MNMRRDLAISSSSVYLIMYLALAALCLSVTSSFALPLSPSLGRGGEGKQAASPVLKNANHIVNAIHSSMRQWGSSLNHNGMSFFLAHIPAGTELYHGRKDNVTVTGMEWLAFEPEHAMNFAQARPPPSDRKPPPGDRQPPPGEDDNGRSDQRSRHGNLDLADHTRSRHQRLLDINGDRRPRNGKDKKSPHGPPHDDFELHPGWLHTYSMKYDLRVLYIDGEAAAKSLKGTLDTQDYVLAPKDDRDDNRGPFGDSSRAAAMCSMAANEWQERIDGFIRMEHGFELILCNFSRSSDLVRMARVSLDPEVNGQDDGVYLFSFLHAIVARYHGIGGERVKVSYDNFVTAFANDIDLFQDNDPSLPRLRDISQPQRERLIASLTDLILTEPSITQPTNWQAIADMILARYSDPLHAFAFETFPRKRDLEHRLSLLLRPFIDYDARNASHELWTCATHFLPPFPVLSVPGTATLEVSRRICSTLFAAYDDEDTGASQIRFRELVEWLQWTSWKECRPGCKYGEFCLTAIWPIGDTESHERPYCVNATGLNDFGGRPGSGDSYWDGPGGPRV